MKNLNSFKIQENKILTGKIDYSSMNRLKSDIARAESTIEKQNKKSCGAFKKDVEIAEFLYKMIETTIETEYRKFERNTKSSAHGKALRHSFVSGMVDRISWRLTEIKNQTINENQEKGLMLYNKFAIAQKKFNEVEKIKIKRRNVSIRTSDSSAYQQGQKAGNNVNLNNPISNSQNSTKRLLIY